MKLPNFFKAIALSLVCCLSSSVFAYAAPTFKDVPPDFWAYDSITKVAEKGVMVGDASGNFKPNDYVDMFSATKIFANTAGYNIIDPSEAELNYYDRAYQKNKNLLDSYDKKYELWKSSFNREIAFLLEKQIFKASDLEGFVTLDEHGKEAQGYLNKGESSVFIVRLMGKEQEALNATYTYKFADDNNIPAEIKPYAYYLQKNGVVVGDSSNRFNSYANVNRSILAVMLDKAFMIIETGATTDTTTNNQVQTINGQFVESYPSLDAVEILSDGKAEMYKLTADSSISIDGFLKTSKELKSGMKLTAVIINGNEIVSIDAKSTITPLPVSYSSPVVLEGTLSEVHLTQDKSYIVIKDKNGKTTQCNFDPSVVKISSYELGDKVSLRLDNNQIVSISLSTQSPAPTSVTTKTL